MLLSGSEWSPLLQGSSLGTREWPEGDARSDDPGSCAVTQSPAVLTSMAYEALLRVGEG